MRPRLTSRIRRMKDSKAKRDDEYFTLYQDIESEVPRYKGQIEGKRIICPCDWSDVAERAIPYRKGQRIGDSFVRDVDLTSCDPDLIEKTDMPEDGFLKFLVIHAKDYGLSGISASRYFPQPGSGIRFQDIDYSEYDVIMTNPPFSVFREFFDVLMDSEKEFLVIGPQFAVIYKRVLEAVMEDEAWLGYGHHLTGLTRPDGTILPKSDNLPRSCAWWTNLDVSVRHEMMELTATYEPSRYPRYVNYDAIHVGRTKDIPKDYQGEMGVPATFLQRYCPEQFEIVGDDRTLRTPMSEIAERDEYNPGGSPFYLLADEGYRWKYKAVYKRLVIRKRNPES